MYIIVIYNVEKFLIPHPILSVANLDNTREEKVKIQHFLALGLFLSITVAHKFLQIYHYRFYPQ